MLFRFSMQLYKTEENMGKSVGMFHMILTSLISEYLFIY